MMFQIRLLRGLRHPSYFTYELKSTEAVGRIWKQPLLLIILSGFLFGLSAHFGIGSEYLSKQLPEMARAGFEMQKALFIAGQVLWGLFYGMAIIYLSALFFWTLSDTELNRFVVMQLLVLMILLLEKALLIPINLKLGVPEISSPFSFGPIAQSLTKNSFLITFFASITIFKLWAISIQYIYIRALTEKSRAIVLAMVLGWSLLLWVITAFFSIIQFEKII